MGLERFGLSRLSAPDPKSGASASFATGPWWTRRELHPHAFRRLVLREVRLLFRHSSLVGSVRFALTIPSILKRGGKLVPVTSR